MEPEALASALDELSAEGRTPFGVYLTSPDYLGFVQDVAGLSAVCHAHGLPLLVDNAHGAYLHFLKEGSRHPIQLGADLCCDSAHKTLPVLTGGAYLHLGPSVQADEAAVRNALALFGSTSPSYLILQSLDAANAILADSFREKLDICRWRLGMLCRELGMECIWPRIFSVYGIYEKETTMIASGLRKMLRGEPTEFTPAMQRWDYLYSKDAGRAYYLIGEKGRDGAVYCIGSGEAHPLKEYILKMAELTGAEETGIGARPYPQGAVMNLCADTESLQRDTGFVPEYTFEEGIRETITWIRSQETGV